MLVLAGLAALHPAVALGQETASPVSPLLNPDMEFARKLQELTRTGKFADALSLLDSRPDISARTETIRLRAALLHEVGRSEEALVLLDAHITRSPDDALARFQFAEIKFDLLEDQAATLSYQLALAGQLDPARRSVAELRLKELQDRREWRFWAGGSVAPDSNFNSATDAARVDLFGLPFELNDDARQQSGVTFSGFTGLERSFRLAPGQALRVNVAGSVTDAPGADFDLASFSARAGPEFRGNGSEVSLQATANQRWLGGDPLETRYGVFGVLDVTDGPTRWQTDAYFDRVDDQLSDGRDGWVVGGDLTRTRYLSPSSLWRASLSLATRRSESDPESYIQARLALGYLTAAPFATMLYVEPYILERKHEEAAIAFGETRRDAEVGIGFRLSKRDWLIGGANPFIALSLAEGDSTLAIGEFSRQRIEFGLTREF